MKRHQNKRNKVLLRYRLIFLLEGLKSLLTEIGEGLK